MKTGKKTLCALALMLLLALAVTVAFSAPVVGRAAVSDSTEGELLSTFTASKGTAVYDGQNETLTFGATVDGAYTQVSLSAYDSGSRWHVKYLDNRSVVMLQINNRGTADSVKAMFVTRTQKTYDDAKSVTLPVKPGAQTLQFDFSALPECKGVLTGLRFVPNGTGEIDIKGISFEREFAHYDYAGSIESCTSDGVTVTVRGKLSGAYAGKRVELFRTDISNMQEKLDGLAAIAHTEADGNDFVLRLPHTDGEISLLSAMFIAAVDGVKVGRMFKIENASDFCQNPYATDFGDNVYDAADYGAVGDGFSDDTDVLQNALDAAALTGGTVVVKGGSTPKYYRITTLTMRSGVCLRVESGAVLWQSGRYSDYKYDYTLGHDVPTSESGGAQWWHCGLTVNYPMIYFGGVENAAVTGGGTLRMLDSGAGLNSAAYQPAYSDGCSNLLHLVPVGVYDSKNIEVSDLRILRASCYHVTAYDCENVYFGNLELTENNCLSGDGISMGVGSKNVIIDRCMMYTSDDAIVLAAFGAKETRGVKWWHTDPEGDNRLQNITLRHSAITPGNVVVFVLWGSDAPDRTLTALDGLYVYDNQLGNDVNASACFNTWAGQGGNNGIAGQVSGAKNVRIFQNAYLGKFNTDVIKRVDWVSDCAALSSTASVVDAAFANNLENWGYDGEYGSDVSVAGGKVNLTARQDAVRVYQGLGLGAGDYTFSAAAEGDGTGTVFAQDALSGEIIGSTSAQGASSLSFSLKSPATVRVGFACTQGSLAFSSPSLSGSGNGYAAHFDQRFDSDARSFDEYGFVRSNGELSIGGGTRFALSGTYAAFDYLSEFVFDESFGDSAGAAYAYIRFGERGKSYSVVLDETNDKVILGKNIGGGIQALQSASAEVKASVWYQLGMSVDEKTVKVFLDGEQVIEYEFNEDIGEGAVSQAFVGVNPRIDRVAAAQSGALTFGRAAKYTEPAPSPGGDETGGDGTSGCGCGSAVSAGGAGIFTVTVLACLLIVAPRRKKPL